MRQGKYIIINLKGKEEQKWAAWTNIYEMYEYAYRDNKFDLVNQYHFISSLTHDFL